MSNNSDTDRLGPCLTRRFRVQERLSQGTLSQTVSRKEDITISEPTLRSAVLEREIEPDILAMPVADELLAEEFRFDLGLELGTPAKRPRLEAEDSMEIEVGRRAEFDNASFVDNFGFAPDDSFVQDAPKGEDAMGTILTDVVMNEAPLDDFQPFDFNERYVRGFAYIYVVTRLTVPRSLQISAGGGRYPGLAPTSPRARYVNFVATAHKSS